MPCPNEPLRLTHADLNSPQVQQYLDVQASMRRDIGNLEAEPLLIRVVYASWFYLAIACALGAFIAWACVEPFFDEGAMNKHEGVQLAALFYFPTVAGFVGLFLGAAEGLMCRNLVRALLGGSVGLGIGFGLGLVGLIPTGIVFGLMSFVAVLFWKDPKPNAMPDGFAFLILMMGRAAAWAIEAIPAGLGLGIALRERKVVFNGVVGAVLGGMLGGMLFDPINVVFSTAQNASLSRCIGFMVIGFFVGLFVGLVEGWTKTAWLLMRAGPLAGKQFVLHRDTTVLGSSPKADIYLFKDDAIEPRHALLHNRGGRFELEDCKTPDGTYVNGVPITRQILKTGDKIVLGKTVLEFALKETK
jgi:hypothetical protein